VAKRAILILVVLILLTLTASAQMAENARRDSSIKIVYIEAFQFGFTVRAIQEGSNLKVYPEGLDVLVNKGDRVLFRGISRDVTHGFYIDGYTTSDQKIFVLPGRILEIGPITFDREGKFKLRCSVTCGPLHPFMVMDVVVRPNIQYYSLLISTLTVGGFTLLYLQRKSENKLLGGYEREVDILKVRFIGSILEKLLKWRGFQFSLILPSIFFFTLVIVSGFFGNPIGNRNFSIAVVWILWFAIVEFTILFAGRFWCAMCPIPAFGEWIARRRIIGVNNSINSISKIPKIRRWPKALNNMWVSVTGFFVLSLFLPWLVTRPLVTAVVFLVLIIAATLLYIMYQGRYFCKHVCPAGYIGYHSNVSILSVRSRKREICKSHKNKDCIKGNLKGYGCPWKLYPGGNCDNTYCGLCFECIKSCFQNNMTLKIRMIGKDLPKIAAKAKNRFDEAWVGFTRFSFAVFYELIFFGSYYWLKDWGNMGNVYGANLETARLLIPPPWGVINWIRWAFLVSTLVLVYPAVFYVFSWISKKVAGIKIPVKQIFLSFSYALVPYGLFVWIAFAVSLLAVFWTYPLTAFSDPFGWGWNIGARFEWDPFYPELLPFFQTFFILTGLALAINTTYGIAKELLDEHKAFRATAVMSILHIISALILIKVIAG